MPISLLSRLLTVGTQNINRFVKSVGIMRVQGDQSLENIFDLKHPAIFLVVLTHFIVAIKFGVTQKPSLLS
jgi:hypothetical protein